MHECGCCCHYLLLQAVKEYTRNQCAHNVGRPHGTRSTREKKRVTCGGDEVVAVVVVVLVMVSEVIEEWVKERLGDLRA